MLENVSLSSNTVKNRIEKSNDIAEQVSLEVEDSKYSFSVQLNESKNVTNNAQLLVYLCNKQDNSEKSELLSSVFSELSLRYNKRKGYFRSFR